MRIGIGFLLLVLLTALPALAHCDTLSGPVIADARAAFAKGDVTPVLKWIKPEHETAVRAAFTKALQARGAGDSAREIADTWFFETLVRLHREGEGETFTGLKTEPVAQPIAAADEAITAGSLEALQKQIDAGIESGLRARFSKVVEAQKHAGDSVEAGRTYVAAYVEFMHYAEALSALSSKPPESHAHGQAHGH